MAKKYIVNGVEYDVDDKDVKNFEEETTLLEGVEVKEVDSGNQQGPVIDVAGPSNQNNTDSDSETISSDSPDNKIISDPNSDQNIKDKSDKNALKNSKSNPLEMNLSGRIVYFNSTYPSIAVNKNGIATFADGVTKLDISKDFDLNYIKQKDKELASPRNVFITNALGVRDAIDTVYSDNDIIQINTNLDDLGYSIEKVDEGFIDEDRKVIGRYALVKNGERITVGDADTVQKWFFNNLSDEEFKVIDNNIRETYKQITLKQREIKETKLNNQDRKKLKEELIWDGSTNSIVHANLKQDVTNQNDLDVLNDFFKKTITVNDVATIDGGASVSGGNKKYTENKGRQLNREYTPKTADQFKYDQLKKVNSILQDTNLSQEDKNAQVTAILGGSITDQKTIDSLNNLITNEVGHTKEDVNRLANSRASENADVHLELIMKDNPQAILLQSAIENHLVVTDDDEVVNHKLQTNLYETQTKDLNNRMTETTNLYQKKFETDVKELASIGISVKVVGEGENARYVVDASNYVGNSEEVQNKIDALKKQRETLTSKFNLSQKKIVDSVKVIERLKKKAEAGELTMAESIQYNQAFNIYQTEKANEKTFIDEDSVLVEDINSIVDNFNKNIEDKRKTLEQEYQKKIDSDFDEYKSFINTYNQSVNKLSSNIEKLQVKIQNAKSDLTYISKEHDLLTVLKTDLKNGIGSLYYSPQALFGDESAKQKLKAIQDGSQNYLPTMLSYKEAIEQGQVGIFAGRTLAQQAPTVAVAVATSSIGLPPMVTSGIFALSAGGETLVQLEGQVEIAKKAQTDLTELEQNYKDGKVSKQDYVRLKTDLEKTIASNNFSKGQIAGAVAASMGAEFIISTFAGTIGNSQKLVSDLTSKNLSSLGSLVNRTNVQAAYQWSIETGKSIASEATEEVLILLSNELSQGLILGKDFDFSQIDDTVVSSILLATPMNGPSSLYNIITQQYQTSGIRNETRATLDQIKALDSQFASLKPGDTVYRKQLTAELSNLYSKLNISQSGLEVDAMIGASDLKDLVANTMDLAELHDSAGVQPGDSQNTIDDKVKNHIEILKDTNPEAASDFEARLQANEKIKQNTRDKIKSELDGDILAENGLVDRLFGDEGRKTHDKLMNKDASFNEMSNREKLTLIHMSLKNDFKNRKVKEARKIPIIREHVERTIYGKQFKDSGRKNRKLKQENQLYEIYSDRLNTRRVQATSTYRDGREAARLILKSNPDISQLSDIEVVADQTVEQLTEFLNKSDLQEYQKEDLLKGLQDGSTKGLILDGKYITTAEKSAVDEALQQGNLIQGTVFSHELGHALDAITMKRGEINDLSSNLSKALIQDKKLADVHTTAVKDLMQIMGPDGKILWEEGKTIDKQRDVTRDEYIKRVQDVLQDPSFKEERQIANKRSGESLGSIVRGLVGGDYKFNSPKAALTYITDYINSFEKKQLSNLVKRKIKAKDARLKQLNDIINEFGIFDDDGRPVFKEGISTQDQKRFNEAVSELDDLQDRPGYKLSGDVGPKIDAAGKIFNNTQWKDGGFEKVLDGMQREGMLDALIFAAQARKNPAVQMKDKSQDVKTRYLNDVYAELTNHVRNFNPDVNDSLFAWINSQLGNKALNVQKRPDYSPDRLSRAQDVEARTEEGAPVIQVAADTDTEMDYIDNIGLNEDQKTQYSKFRQDLGLDAKMMDKVRQAVITAFGTKLPDINSKKFKQALEKQFRDQLKKPIQDMMGSRTDFDAFLVNQFPAIFRSLPVETLVQMERNVAPENRIFTESKRITKPTEVDKLISDGLLPKDTNRLSGPLLNTKKKLPSDAKILAYFRGVDMENVLGYKVGNSTLGTRKDKLAMEIGVELAFDATSEVLQSPDVQERRKGILEIQGQDQLQNEKAIIAKIIDRDPNVLFSRDGKTSKFPKNYSGEMFGQHFDQLTNDIIESDTGVDGFIDNNGKLTVDYGFKIPQFTIDVVASVFNGGVVDTSAEIKFKKDIFANPNIPDNIKQKLKDSGVLNRKNTKALDEMQKANEELAKLLGPNIVNDIDLEILGYHLRYMDAAKEKRSTKKPGAYYNGLQNVLKIGNNSEVSTDIDVDINNISPMNIGIKGLFPSIVEIQNLDITAAEKKTMFLDQLAKISEDGGIANKGVAKHIVKKLIQLVRSNPGKYDAAFFNILQAQTNLKSGFRAYTDLAGVDFRNNSQALYVDKNGKFTNDKKVLDDGGRVNKKHPQFNDVKKDFPNLTDAEAINLLRPKGEHVGPNAATMGKIFALAYDMNADIDAELDNILLDHSQVLTSFYVTEYKIDAAYGKNSTLGFARLNALGPDAKNFIGLKGESVNDIIQNKIFQKNNVLFSKDNGRVSNNIKNAFKAEENLRKTIDAFNKQAESIKKQNKAIQADLEKSGYTFINKRGMSTFDFDETVGISDNFVIAKKDGETKRISSANWPKVGEKLAAEGWSFDFSDFNKVTKGRPGPLFQKMKNQIAKYGADNVFILTARASESEQAIHDWLKSNGIDIPRENVTGLGNSTGEAKAQWMLGKFAEGYNDMYFVDDAITNVDAVKNVLDQLDIKSKVVQARINFSRDADATFNKMLERSLGIGKDKVFSAAEARIRGKGKGRLDFFVPASAEDFKGLLYSFLGTGKQGEADMQFFKENLLDPYAQGYKDWNSYKQNMADDYKNLKKRFPDVVKSFNNIVPGTSFTAEMAARVYLWNKSGLDVPGLSKQAKRKLLSYVNANTDLRNFADNTANITKNQDGYVKPREYWMTETFASDLANTVNNVGRQRFLANWQQNSDLIFSEKNLNKIEAAKGPAFREALENMLYRMKTGNNRMTGTDRTVNRFQNWLNGSVGAIMFFNIRSAALQTISTFNYIDFDDNNIFKASKAFANQPQFWRDFSMLFNSDMLKQRRAGLAIDVSASELSKAFSDGRGKPQAVLNYLLQLGFTPTQVADNFAIAIGGASFYRNKVNRYLKDGMTKADAESQAFLDFQEKTEETQQSSRPDLISQQQAGPLGRLVLAFQNTPMQMTRLTKKAISDLVNNRGDRRANISKIIYYGAMQNLIFGTLQSGLGFLLFGSDEEDDEKKEMSAERVLNGALDSLLRGTGVYGAGIAALKNTIMQWQEEKQKSFGQRDDTRILLQALNLSPPIGSKLRKINNAIKTEKFNKGVSKELGFRIENPNVNKWANIIEGTTNFPLARMVNKANNLEEAITGDHETWKRVALIAGWDRWSLNVQDEELEAAKLEAKRKRKEQKQKEKEQKKKEEEAKLPPRVRCTAIKSNGERCKNNTRNKNEKCYAHQ